LVVQLRNANAVNKSNVDRSGSPSLGDDRVRMMIMMTIEEKVQRDSDTSASHRLVCLWLPNESRRRRLLGHHYPVDRLATARNAIKRVLIEVRQSSAFQPKHHHSSLHNNCDTTRGSGLADCLKQQQNKLPWEAKAPTAVSNSMKVRRIKNQQVESTDARQTAMKRIKHAKQHADSFMFYKSCFIVMLLASCVNKNDQHLQLLVIVVVAKDGKLPIFCPCVKTKKC
jgi:hypothetical protein